MVKRRIKGAKFPVTKSLDRFYFKAIPKRATYQQHVYRAARGAEDRNGRPKWNSTS